MTKINIVNLQMTIKLVEKGEKRIRSIEIINGKYEYEEYTWLVINNDAVLLEGAINKITPLSTIVSSIYITIKTPLELIAEQVGQEVYFSGIDAIEEGTERELLNIILIKQ